MTTELIEREAQPAEIISAGPLAMAVQAMKQGMSVADMRGMLELQKEWEANEARKSYNEAMASFKAEAIEIIKRKEVNFTNKAGTRTNYKHAELSDVVEAVGPALSRHGFSWSWTPSQDKGWVTVTCTLKHRQGHSESVQLSAPSDDSGGKNAVQQIVSTVTYLSRHTLKAICGVSEKGDDSDGAAPAAREIPKELLTEARNKAMEGWKAFAAWIKTKTEAERLLLEPESANLKAAARAADAQGAK